MKMKITGLRELEKALAALPAATGKNVLRRVSKEALKPVETAARAMAPVDDGDLRDSIVTTTRLSKRRASEARKEGKSTVETYTGTNSRNGVPREFGTVRSAATPFLRPAYDANKDRMLRYVGTELGGEIEKAAARLGKKRAKSGG